MRSMVEGWKAGRRRFAREPLSPASLTPPPPLRVVPLPIFDGEANQVTGATLSDELRSM